MRVVYLTHTLGIIMVHFTEGNLTFEEKQYLKSRFGDFKFYGKNKSYMERAMKKKAIELFRFQKDNGWNPWRDLFTNMLLARMHTSKNTMIIVIGELRSGKTYFSMNLGEMLKDYRIIRRFDINHVYFDLEKMMKEIPNYKNDYIILDEAGLQVSPSEWWSMQNRVFNYMSQMWGFRGLICVMTVPHLMMVTEKVKALTDFVVWMMNRKTARIYKMRSNVFTGTIYNKPFYHLTDLPKPSKEIIDAYEKMKKENWDKFLEESLQKLEHDRMKKLGIRQKTTISDDTKKKILKMRKKGKSLMKIAKECGVSVWNVRKTV